VDDDACLAHRYSFTIAAVEDGLATIIEPARLACVGAAHAELVDELARPAWIKRGLHCAHNSFSIFVMNQTGGRFHPKYRIPRDTRKREQFGRPVVCVCRDIVIVNADARYLRGQ